VSFSFLREKRDANGRKESDTGCTLCLLHAIALRAPARCPALPLLMRGECAEFSASFLRSYDPSTLSVLLANGEKLTPAMQQYWDIKKNHHDVVIFFKMGKFYELFEEDALV